MFIVDSKSSSTDVSRNGSEENFTRASNKEMSINHLIFAFLNRRHRSSIKKKSKLGQELNDKQKINQYYPREHLFSNTGKRIDSFVVSEWDAIVVIYASPHPLSHTGNKNVRNSYHTDSRLLDWFFRNIIQLIRNVWRNWGEINRHTRPRYLHGKEHRKKKKKVRKKRCNEEMRKERRLQKKVHVGEQGASCIG